MHTFKNKLLSLPENSFYVIYKNEKYLVTKNTLLHGKLIKFYAECLSKIDIVSANYYVYMKNGLLKPCEMSPKKVIDFVNIAKIIN